MGNFFTFERLAVFGESQNQEGTPVQFRDSTSCCEACTGFEP